jgi:hypothetical protein
MCGTACTVGEVCAKTCHAFTPSFTCTAQCTGGADGGCCPQGSVCCLPKNDSQQVMCVEGSVCPVTWR